MFFSNSTRKFEYSHNYRFRVTLITRDAPSRYYSDDMTFCAKLGTLRFVNRIIMSFFLNIVVYNNTVIDLYIISYS